MTGAFAPLYLGNKVRILFSCLYASRGKLNLQGHRYLPDQEAPRPEPQANLCFYNWPP